MIFLKCLLCLPAEWAHALAIKLIPWFYKPSQSSVKQMNNRVAFADLSLPNPVGLAAGLDKDGRCLDAWFAMGFGFVEVGTVTPKPQPGNPKPRLFRLKACQALINRMGFNNEGVEALVERLKRRKTAGIVGVNIGKNKETPLEKAAEDYCFCFKKVAPYADYVTINISSPNTPGLRNLQTEGYLDHLLGELTVARQQETRRVPLLVKIAPDLEETELNSIVNLFLKHQIDGIIATNTTIDRTAVSSHFLAKEEGGLSGCPLYERSKRIVQLCLKLVAGRIPVIAVGGIDCPERAAEMLQLGASAVQLYTGFIYQGPALIDSIIKRLEDNSSVKN